MKKAQGLPINVIIIAVIALILLVIVVGITTGKLKGFGKGVADCKVQGGTCKASCDSERDREIPKTSCVDDASGPACCIALY